MGQVLAEGRLLGTNGVGEGPGVEKEEKGTHKKTK